MLETNVWSTSGTSFFPASNATQNATLPPGVYEYRNNMQGWWLEQIGARFTFPYKIYGTHDHITQRIEKAWDNLPSNLGILLNGVKGTGKTVAAQLVANWAIDKGFPVLVVSRPIPLANILPKVMQPIVVIFDEFEKTHAEEKDQQELLTTLDGMGRHSFRRLFILTTNNKDIEANFIDRPSRIRYSWEFDRLEDDVIQEIMDDMLEDDLQELRPAISTYLNTRQVLSIDVVKTVISEVNIFREEPTAFEAMMNLSARPPRGFTLTVVDKEGQDLKVLTSYFKPLRGWSNNLLNLLNRAGCKHYVENVVEEGNHWDINDINANRSIRLLRPTDDPNVWVCNIRISDRDTWISKYPKIRINDYYWVDKKPEGWKVPDWAIKLQKGHTLTADEVEEQYEWSDSETLYGTNELAEFLIRIEPNLKAPNWSTQAF